MFYFNPRADIFFVRKHPLSFMIASSTMMANGIVAKMEMKRQKPGQVSGSVTHLSHKGGVHVV